MLGRIVQIGFVHRYSSVGKSAKQIIDTGELGKVYHVKAQLSRRRGIPGVFVDLEPHVKAGGQYGGFSGPDGMGVAMRSLCRVLDYTNIEYHVRDFDDIRAARGF